MSDPQKSDRPLADVFEDLADDIKQLRTRHLWDRCATVLAEWKGEERAYRSCARLLRKEAE